MMMTKKFFERKRTELFDYIRRRMDIIKEKCNSSMVRWDEEYYRFKPYTIIIVDGEAYPSLAFLELCRSFRDIPIAFEFVKWCLDGLESYLEQTFRLERGEK